MVCSGCAPKGPSPQLVAEIAKADALLSEGCYTCLKEALAIFDKHAAGEGADPRRARRPVRRRAADRDSRKGAWAFPPTNRWSRGVAQTRRCPTRQAGARRRRAHHRRHHVARSRPARARHRAAIVRRSSPTIRSAAPSMRRPRTDLAAKYVALSIDCEQQKLIESVDMKALTTRLRGRAADAVPAVDLRTSGGAQRRRAARTRSALDGHASTGKRGTRWSPRSARRSTCRRSSALYGQGREAFPSSLMLTMAWANANLMAEEFESALSGFEDVLKAYPTHRDAMNGKMQAQSYLMRHPDAIATATRLLELGTWNIADANYWRAWNRYHLKEYDSAWADVENAIKGLSNSARLHARRLDRLRAQGAADRRRSLRYRVQDRSQRLRCGVDVGTRQHRSERAGGRRPQVHAQHDVLRQRRRRRCARIARAST